MSKCSYSVSCFSPIRALINNSTGAIAVVCSSRAVHRTAATAFDSILSETHKDRRGKSIRILTVIS